MQTHLFKQIAVKRILPLLLASGFMAGVAFAALPPADTKSHDIEWSGPVQMTLPVKRPDALAKQNQMSAQVLLPSPRPLEEKVLEASAKPSVPALPATMKKRDVSFISRVFADSQTAKRLSPEEALRARTIFALQKRGDFRTANVGIRGMQDDRLYGYILADRYLQKDYKASYAELVAWLKNYSDLAPANAIYNLAQKRKPADAPSLPLPANSSIGLPGMHDADVGQFPAPMRQTPAIKADVDQTDRALQAFYKGDARRALQLAGPVALRSGAEVPLSGWIAGLSAWRLKEYQKAAGFFETVASAPRATPWMSSAGGYWAARSHLRSREPQKVSHWLVHAAKHPRTFYGIIALKALGQEQSEFNWALPTLDPSHVKILSKVPAGRRALALMDAGRSDLAQKELAKIRPGRDQALQEAMLAVAGNAMPALSMRMGSMFRDKNDNLYDAALYPDAPWQPEQGFSVDRALVFAFIRQESQFEHRARNSSSGAKGLMQLMPATAQHVADGAGLDFDTKSLHDPITNIDLGQRYIAELLDMDVVDQNLFKLAVAYNAGPGKLTRWQQSVRYEDDPLLFIESIPVAETRIFVERVLTNYWIYRIKYNQDTPSLEAVAEGDWPVYASQDDNLRARMALADYATVP
jgi:soluble lytic murein transglycosylase